MQTKSRAKSVHLDAEDYAFFQRELEFIKRQEFQVEYAELQARKFIPVSNETPNWARTVTYTQWNKVGIWKIISDYSKDLPRTDVKGEQFTATVRTLGGSYGWNVDEIKEAAATGRRLDRMRALNNREGQLRLENTIALVGDSDYSIVGLFNHPNTINITIPDPGSGTEFVNKTPDQVLSDLFNVANGPFDNTFQVEVADTMLLPPAQYNYVGQTRITDTAIAIIEYFKKNHPTVKNVGWAAELAGIGAGSTDRAFAYRRDPSKLQLEIPQEYEALTPEQRGLEHIVNATSKIAGVIYYKPMSSAKGDGI